MSGRWGQGDLLAGIVAAAALLLLAYALDFHLVIAISLSVAIYVSIMLLRPPPKPPQVTSEADPGALLVAGESERTGMPLPSANGAAPPAGDRGKRRQGVNLEAAARFGLTAREIDVLPLLAQRLTNAEIAERLFISEKTAMNHATHTLGKLGLSNRREVADFAAKHDLLYPSLPPGEHG